MQVLFYYKGFQNNHDIMAGTSTIMFRLASMCAKKHPTVIMGDSVERAEVAHDVQIVPTPEKTHILEAIAGFDVVVFCSSIHVAKPRMQSSQVWVRHQHCWNLGLWDYGFYQACDVVMGVSEVHAENLRYFDLGKKVKLRYVPNAIDTTIFHPASLQRNRNAIVYAGAISRIKGTDKLIDAFKILLTRMPQATLEIYGSSSMVFGDQAFERDVKAMAVGLPIQFHGTVTKKKLAAAYSTASVLCLPSLMESFGLVTVEAQACGCIPVVSNVGGTSATVIDGRTGFLYGPNSPGALADALVHALSVADTMRGDAIKFAKENFTMGKAWSAFERILEEVV